jgi:glutamyl-tRNA reductase
VETTLSAVPTSFSRLVGEPFRPEGPPKEIDPDTTPLTFFDLEFSLDTASLDELEGVARSVSRARVADWFSRFPETKEVALLPTCHRVELAVLAQSPREVDRWRAVLPGPRAHWRLRSGRDAVHHLFRVAAGRESLAIGEAEVRQQVRVAGFSVESRHPRPVLRELFASAARAADAVAPIVPTACSVAAIAAARLLDLVGRRSPRVLVVGSGVVGRQVAESLAPSAQVTVVFHQRPPDDAFLRSTGARAVPLERLREEIAASDAVVTAAKFGHRGLGVSDLLPDRPIVLVDLGVPRNIDPEARLRPHVRLVDLEELHSLPVVDPASDGRDAEVHELADRFSDRFERLLLEPWIGSLRRAAERLRRSELANARSYLGDLDPEQELAVERLTQRLVARLLDPATERLRSLPPGPEGDRQRRFAAELLRPRLTEP